jgi:hypothetical protein
MVRKFVLLKTNKEAEGDEYPAYVMHYTDFSPNRKDPLSRDVCVSNSREQIEELYEQSKVENIKKGWNPANGELPAVSEPDEKPVKQKATKKKVAQKKVSNKKTTKKAADPDAKPAKKKKAK